MSFVYIAVIGRAVVFPCTAEMRLPLKKGQRTLGNKRPLLGPKSYPNWIYNSTKSIMSECGSSNNGSYFHNTIISWKNKLCSPKVEGTLNSNMVALPHERNMDMVKLDATRLTMDIVHYLTNYQIQPSSNEHARTMRRVVDQVRVKHQIPFNSITKRLELPTEEQEDI